MITATSRFLEVAGWRGGTIATQVDQQPTRQCAQNPSLWSGDLEAESGEIPHFSPACGTLGTS